MTYKHLAIALLCLHTGVAAAEDRIGHFDQLTPQVGVLVNGGVRAKGGEINCSSNVAGITFSSPGDDDSGMESPGDGVLAFRANCTEILRLTYPNVVTIAGVAYTFPGDDGNDGDVLTSDGAGALTWVAPSVDLPITDTDSFATRDNLVVINAAPTVTTLEGNNGVLNVAPNLGTFPSLNVLNIFGTLGTQEQNTLYAAVNENSGFTTLSASTMLNDNIHGDTIRNNLALVDSGNEVDLVERSWLPFNLHKKVNELRDGYTGYSDSNEATTLVSGDLKGISLNNKSSVPGDAYGLVVTQQITQRGLTAQVEELTVRADVGGDLAGKYFRKCSAYANNPNVCYAFWYKVSGSGSAPSSPGSTLVEIDIETDDPAASVGDATQDAVDGVAHLSATDDDAGVVTITEDTAGRSGRSDPGDSGFSSTVITGGGGDGSYKAISVGAGQISGYAADNIIAFDSGGYRVNLGRINAGTEFPLVDNGGNPSPINTINTNFTTANNVDVANDDHFGFGPIMSVTLGDNSDVTSGGFGLGLASLGAINLLQLGTNATADNVTGFFNAHVLPAGAGHIDNLTGFLSIAANVGATTTIDNLYLYKTKFLAGDPSTNSWGFHDANGKYNWFKNSLKIGGTDGSTDRTSGTNKLEVDGSSFTTAITATGAMGIGTTAPSEQLEIKSSNPFFSADTTGDFGGVWYKKSGVGRWAMGMNTTLGDQWGVARFDSGGSYQEDSLVVKGATGDVVVSKNLGIGTGSPTVRLDVNGSAKINDAGGNGGNVPHGHSRVSNTSTSSASCAAVCPGGQVATGGGCDNTVALNLYRSYPTAADTWNCEYTLATGDCTAWAVCFEY
jgi:hypothetical protein